MNFADLVIELSTVCGPSGFEDKPRQLICQKLKPLCDEIKVDPMGNILAFRRCGKEGAKLLMLDAHMDEIGFIITGHEDGYLRFSTIGGVDPRMLPAAEIRILTDEPLYGVVDVMPPHALKADEMGKALPVDKLFIDIGMTQEQAEKAVPVGTPAVYATGAQRIGEDSICGKALDDRACAAIIIKAMEQLKDKELDVDVCCLISTQEELGCRGATVGAFGAQPDYCIALDVTHGETPDAPKHQTVKMGNGAAIGIGPNFNRAFTNAIMAVAKAENIPYEPEVISGHSGTDAWVIQTSRGGVASALLSLPIKYMHSPVETMRISDGEKIVSLLASFISKFGEVM